MMRKIALEFVVTDDHAVKLIEALGDPAKQGIGRTRDGTGPLGSGAVLHERTE